MLLFKLLWRMQSKYRQHVYCNVCFSFVAQIPIKPRTSRFSSQLIEKKIYFPTDNIGINYESIFNGAERVNIETSTHTTITVAGTSVCLLNYHDCTLLYK